LLGDISNVLGALLQGVLPTMTVLAMYYVAADLVLLGQCFYYRGSSKRSSRRAIQDEGPEVTEVTEDSPLLPRETERDVLDPSSSGRNNLIDVENGSNNQPVPPSIVIPPYPSPAPAPASVPVSEPSTVSSWTVSILYKLSAVLLVCMAGTTGWYLSSSAPRKNSSTSPSPEEPPPQNPTSSPHLHLWGQIFGYLCAALYLGSRLPQILLNIHRKSTEGVSILFFIFACIGNVAYSISIFAYEPRCIAGIERAHNFRVSGEHGTTTCENAGDWQREYWKYIVVNASWIAGSVGALILDLIIFAQFWVYREGGKEG
jgi:uncharacterized protein with PQ loop repeat